MENEKCVIRITNYNNGIRKYVVNVKLTDEDEIESVIINSIDEMCYLSPNIADKVVNYLISSDLINPVCEDIEILDSVEKTA